MVFYSFFLANFILSAVEYLIEYVQQFFQVSKGFSKIFWNDLQFSEIFYELLCFFRVVLGFFCDNLRLCRAIPRFYKIVMRCLGVFFLRFLTIL